MTRTSDKPGGWLSKVLRRYRRHVGQGAIPAQVKAVPRPDTLYGLEGKWVAVADGEVIAAADTSHELALQLHAMDHRKSRAAVIEYVRPESDAYIVGVG